MINPKTNPTRRIACHSLVLTDRSVMKLMVLELRKGTVCKWYPLTRETAHTEFLPGEIMLRRDDSGCLRAWHEGEVLE